MYKNQRSKNDTRESSPLWIRANTKCVKLQLTLPPSPCSSKFCPPSRPRTLLLHYAALTSLRRSFMPSLEKLLKPHPVSGLGGHGSTEWRREGRGCGTGRQHLYMLVVCWSTRKPETECPRRQHLRIKEGQSKKGNDGQHTKTGRKRSMGSEELGIEKNKLVNENWKKTVYPYRKEIPKNSLKIQVD